MSVPTLSGGRGRYLRPLHCQPFVRRTTVSARRRASCRGPPPLLDLSPISLTSGTELVLLDSRREGATVAGARPPTLQARQLELPARRLWRSRGYQSSDGSFPSSSSRPRLWQFLDLRYTPTKGNRRPRGSSPPRISGSGDAQEPGISWRGGHETADRQSPSSGTAPGTFW